MAKQENNLYYKNCDQCGEKKRADTYFEKAGNSEDGYRNTCSKCIRDNRMKKEEEHVRAKAAADALSKKPFTSENKEPPEKKTGKFTVSVDLPKYCAQEGISVEKVTSDSKMPVIADARKRIARAMVADGIDRKLVALKLKIGASTLWNYLQEDNPESDKPKKPEVIKKDKPVITLDFTDREDLYEEICNIAEERLRKPAGQVLWWLMNADFDKLIGGMAGE